MCEFCDKIKRDSIMGKTKEEIEKEAYDWFRNNPGKTFWEYASRNTRTVKKVCEWTAERGGCVGVLYHTNCGDSFLWGDFEEIPKEFKHCPYCGSQIKIIEETE